MDADVSGGISSLGLSRMGMSLAEERVAGATGVPPLANLESLEGLIIAVGAIQTRVL